jgi:hypothetical protein
VQCCTPMRPMNCPARPCIPAKVWGVSYQRACTQVDACYRVALARVAFEFSLDSCITGSSASRRTSGSNDIACLLPVLTRSQGQPGEGTLTKRLKLSRSATDNGFMLSLNTSGEVKTSVTVPLTRNEYLVGPGSCISMLCVLAQHAQHTTFAMHPLL